MDKDYKECLRTFMKALECERVDEFVELCTIKDCHNLGLAFQNALKRKLSELDLSKLETGKD